MTVAAYPSRLSHDQRLLELSSNQFLYGATHMHSATVAQCLSVTSRYCIKRLNGRS